MINCYLTLLLILVLTGCASFGHNPILKVAGGAPLSDLETEEYAVYSAIIDSGYIRDSKELVVIKNQTSLLNLIVNKPEDTRRFLTKYLMDDLENEMIEDFQTKNGQPLTLRNGFKIKARYLIISESDQQEIYQKRGDWVAFFEKYPTSQGLLSLSRIGFNHELNRALVYLAHRGGVLSGGGDYMLLVKEKGAWTIKRKVSAWVA